MTKQKYLRGYRVKIADTMPDYMSHFPCGCEAIVDYTYSEKYGGSDIESYSLLLLDVNGKGYNKCAWYEEGQLTLISDDMIKGMEILELYNKR